MKSEITTDDYCFACGKQNPIGLKLEIKECNGGVCFKTKLKKEYQGWTNIIHGGIVSCLLDELMVWAPWIKGIDAVTAELTIRFRNPSPVGETIEGRGWITKEKGKVIFTEAKITSQGKVLATGQAKLMKI